LDGKSCKFTPANIQTSHVTHINYAFAVMNSSYDVVKYEWNDYDFYQQLQAKKAASPGLKTLIAIGGWNFNLYESTKHLFTNMAASQTSRAHFISSAIEFARTRGFDGIDFDWEYPGWPDQGGREQDTPNFTLLLAEFRAAIIAEAASSGNNQLILTIAAPAGPQKIALIEVSKIHESLDWLNIMTYDLHGSWDSTTGPHTALQSSDNLTMEHAIQLYMDAGVPAAKIVVGLAAYGRTWTLSDSMQRSYGSPATGAGTAGVCTQEKGYLNSMEIAHLVKNGGKMVTDSATTTAYAWNEDQFVTFDTVETHSIKTQWICDHGLGGAMMWAMDLDDDFVMLNSIYDKIMSSSCNNH
jgi:chitinase